MSDSTQKLTVEAWMSFALLGTAFAALCCIAVVVAWYARHPFGWKAISLELFKVPLILLLVWRAWKTDVAAQTTAIQFSVNAFALSILSDVMFILAER